MVFMLGMEESVRNAAILRKMVFNSACISVK